MDRQSGCDMRIELQRISNGFDGKQCYVHARGLMMPSGFCLVTMQKLELSGCDVFYGIEMMKSADGGKSYSRPIRSENLGRRYFEDGTSIVLCDATPIYHRASGKILLTGHTARYGKDNALLCAPRERSTGYAVYDEETGDFGPLRTIEMPRTPDQRYFSSGAGCSQILELEGGDLLIPFYFSSYEKALDPWHSCTSVAVMRCSFDGETIRIKEIGNELTVTVPRGLGEPSIARFGSMYYLALRNDETGFVSRSSDGLHFEEPRELCFDDGTPLGNYNTQQHWIGGGGRLWLVYTRRAGTNDHIFRHRAPLFIAELDPERLCVIRESERVAVPERGARLGNFGCQSYSDGIGYVFASEWMQGKDGYKGCMAHGSDNSLFISKIVFDR